jgi:tetratricopeptide (TPR) repeat protein
LSAQTATISSQPPAQPWLYRPWLDLLVGCGAWSAPLLAIATLLTPAHTHAWSVAFYALAIVFNYPHFMATIYRAYHTRESFEKYKILTLHVTLLVVLTGILLHASPRLLPWVFTLYICWSPWHYSGQNYGLLMMFARRAGASITSAERRWIRAAFIASYLMLLASFETGGSSDALVLSLGLPAKFTLWARLALGAAFAILTALGFRRLIARSGWRAMAAPLLLALTQFLWFVLPTLLELDAAHKIPQTQYSSGILAVLHSAQYLWVTSYYQRNEARAAGQSAWRMGGYFLTLIAGGIALFIPGPWLVSYALHFDFTTSLLIFTALVNIHHFILDAGLWKLRNPRVASLLIDQSSQANAGATTTAPAAEKMPAAARSAAARLIVSPAFRLTLAGLLLLWGAAEEIRYALGTDVENLPALTRASQMNPYDSSVEARIALAEGKAGQRDAALDSLRRAAVLNSQNATLQQAYAKALLESGRYQDAYDHYGTMLKKFPRNENALVNYGVLAARSGHPEAAIDSWQKAAQVDPDQPNPHLYLAEAFEQRGDVTGAARQWQEYLRAAALWPDDPAARLDQQASAAVQLADDELKLARIDLAIPQYQAAIGMAERIGDRKLQAVAFSHLADAQEKAGDAKSAAISYQRGLKLDEKAGDPRGEAIDWFSYGQFLGRHNQSDDLVYACFVRAEELLKDAQTPELATVQAARRNVENRLGTSARKSPSALPELLVTAATLPPASF